jgi:hypothetical protein
MSKMIPLRDQGVYTVALIELTDNEIAKWVMGFFNIHQGFEEVD